MTIFLRPFCQQFCQKFIMEKKSQSKIAKKEPASEGKTTRNPFLNFVQEFRKNNRGIPAQEQVARAAEAWRKMSDNEKAPYYEMAKRAPKRRKRRGRRRGRRMSSYSRQRSGSRSSRYSY
ncbi:HMG1/2-like protein [Tribolium madens]|uniref:HMG1/2-like protein n=1 Tax=Tribolium madens TaxID=41895 RepID=UPI001CF74872|nr:HMG1/2-like protein [Tribolium madens]